MKESLLESGYRRARRRHQALLHALLAHCLLSGIQLVNGDLGPDQADTAVVVLGLAAGAQATRFKPGEQLADNLAEAGLACDDLSRLLAVLLIVRVKIAAGDAAGFVGPLVVFLQEFDDLWRLG